MRGSLLILYSTLCADYVLDMIVVKEIVSLMEIVLPIKHCYDNENLTLLLVYQKLNFFLISFFITKFISNYSIDSY